MNGRYKLFSIVARDEKQIGSFSTMVEACDESYRRFGTTFVGDSWSHYEMIAEGFGKHCSEEERQVARRIMGLA